MAVTVSYKAPYASAPTALQQHNSPRNTIIATVAAGLAADAQAIVTHNFGLTNAQITSGYPVVILTPQDGNEITSPWYETSQHANYTVLGKGTTAAGGTIKAEIMRTAGTPNQ